MPKRAAPQYKWLEKMGTSQLVYASKRLGIVHIGLDRSGVIAAVRAHDRRAVLKEPDVKHMRPTWGQLQRSIDWASCGWEREWERRVDRLGPYGFLPTDDNATKSRMIFVKYTLRRRWANMPAVIMFCGVRHAGPP